MRKLALQPLFCFPGNVMKGFSGLTSFRGCVLSWLMILNLDRGIGGSFDIYYHNSPTDTYLKHFINAYRCVCWMKSTSIDGLDVLYIRPWRMLSSKSAIRCNDKVFSSLDSFVFESFLRSLWELFLHFFLQLFLIWHSPQKFHLNFTH